MNNPSNVNSQPLINSRLAQPFTDSISHRSCPTSPPQEPGMLGRAQELLHHIGNLENEHAILRAALFSEKIAGADAEGIAPAGLEAMLSNACTRVACMVGDMATINGKVA